MESTKSMDIGEATIALAASACARTAELLADGWVKGRLNAGPTGAEQFCIHGAMALALEEIFGQTKVSGRVPVCGGYAVDGRSDVEAIATAFIVDEAATRYGYNQDAWKHGSLGAAAFNDAPERRHSEVLEVVENASKRLWDLTLETQTAEKAWAPSKWASDEYDQEGAKAFLYNTYAPVQAQATF